MKKNLLKKIIVIMFVAVLAVSFTGCSSIITILSSAISQPDPDDATETSLYLLESALNCIVEDCVYELTDEEILAAAVAGANTIMHYYDNYGYLFTPENTYLNLYAPETYGDIFGFAFSQIKYCGLLIGDIVIDSSAYRAGLLDGDLIIDIKNGDGTDITYLDENEESQTLKVMSTELDIISEVISELNSVKLTILRGSTEEGCYRDGTNMTFNLVREGIINDNATAENEMEYVQYYVDASCKNTSSKTIELRSLALLDGSGVGYIHIAQFGRTFDSNGDVINTCSQEFKKALDTLKDKGCTKLIIDVQDNPGGYVVEVANVAKYLIYSDSDDNGLLITTLVYRDGTEDKTRVDSKYDEFFDNRDEMSIVILSNEDSASGSELLIGVLRDYETAVQVGTTTFGKGIAQTPEGLGDLGTYTLDIGNDETFISYYCLYYTCAKYYSPVTNTCIHAVGYTPETENVISGYPLQLGRALEILNAD